MRNSPLEGNHCSKLVKIHFPDFKYFNVMLKYQSSKTSDCNDLEIYTQIEVVERTQLLYDRKT